MAEHVVDHTKKENPQRQPEDLSGERNDERRASLNHPPPEVEAADTFPIVAIGASAGGLEALESFFSNMPPEPGLSVVVIQHLSPESQERHEGAFAG